MAVLKVSLAFRLRSICDHKPLKSGRNLSRSKNSFRFLASPLETVWQPFQLPPWNTKKLKYCAKPFPLWPFPSLFPRPLFCWKKLTSPLLMYGHRLFQTRTTLPLMLLERGRQRIQNSSENNFVENKELFRAFVVEKLYAKICMCNVPDAIGTWITGVRVVCCVPKRDGETIRGRPWNQVGWVQFKCGGVFEKIKAELAEARDKSKLTSWNDILSERAVLSGAPHLSVTLLRLRGPPPSKVDSTRRVLESLTIRAFPNVVPSALSLESSFIVGWGHPSFLSDRKGY